MRHFMLFSDPTLLNEDSMDICDLVKPESIIPVLRASSKRQALQELARFASGVYGVDETAIFDSLIERERLGSTGVGNGIAIPHSRLESLDDVKGVFAVLEKPIEFDAIDDAPVDLMFLLLAPVDSGTDHLKALARVSRLLRDRTICEKLRKSDTAVGLFNALTGENASKAA
jgi:PTS system nitrogen regulatory IIA component